MPLGILAGALCVADLGVVVGMLLIALADIANLDHDSPSRWKRPPNNR
ncbi:hypothetical protein ACW9HQ_36755 [Nocardia gipuzkoensis]